MSNVQYYSTDNSLMNAINLMGGMPSSKSSEECLSYIGVFNRDKRSEFRDIYDSIIDSTLAAMY